MFGPQQSGPTVGTLEHAIMHDAKMAEYDKQVALMKLKQDTGYAPSNTPLSGLLGGMGGGALGVVVAKYFGMGAVGQILSSLAGYGIGKVISDFYKPNELKIIR